MNCWFIRCNGETLHNEPRTPLFVPGEPPKLPNRKFNYTAECRDQGFARVGWPAAGDLRDSTWRTRASVKYGKEMEARHWRYLEQFRTITVGDIVTIPSGAKRYSVHVGLVTGKRGGSGSPVGAAAYYYHHDVPNGDWYENAHRVDVNWMLGPQRLPAAFDVPEIGGLWLRGFGRIEHGRDHLKGIASRG